MHRPAFVQLYHLLDAVTEWLIFGLIIMTPWAFGCTESKTMVSFTLFGCTQPWSIGALDITGYILGIFFLTKVVIRWSGYRPAGRSAVAEAVGGNNFARAALPWLLGSLTVLILGFCLVSLLNAQSRYHSDTFTFEYLDFIGWLPHSSEQASTRLFLVNHLALAGAFWGILDWLRERSLRGEPAQLSARLQRLLWVMSINGCALAVEGILQRLSGTNELLWIAKTHMNASAEYQFGPYAYRANAAQYFNLLWPVTLGFWWVLHNAEQRGRRRHHLLLLCAGLMAACPILSNSRAGAVIALAALIASGGILFFSLRHSQGDLKFGIFLVLLAIVGVGLLFGGKKLTRRMQDIGLNFNQREQTYAAAADMAKEHPLYGTGPGTFEMMFQFYRGSVDDFWPAQLHNDWLETLITFGWAGSALIGLAFLLVLGRWFVPGGLPADWTFVSFVWLGLGTCLLHARFDFPLQILSILLLFLILCAILFSVSRPAAAGEA